MAQSIFESWVEAEIERIIRSNRYKIETDTARDYLSRNDKKGYGDFKRKNFPAITPNAYFEMKPDYE